MASSSSYPDAFIDHIMTGNLMTDPVLAEDNVTYERSAIEAWFESCEQCAIEICSPSTRVPMGKTLHPCIGTRNAIEEWQQWNHLPVGNEESNHSKRGKRKLETQSDPVYCSAVSSSDNSYSSVDIPRTAHSSILELSRYFEYLDPCRDTLHEALNGWTPPCVVLLGTESSGKSSVIERITMMSLFPQADQICTRIAVHVRLRHHPEAKAPELEVFCTETNQVLRRRVIPISTGHIDVKEEMERIVCESSGDMQRVSGINSKVILVVHIQSPRVPTLDLLDLPGIVAGATEGEPIDMSEQTLALAKGYISRYSDCGIFLAVNRATHNSNADIAYGLVQQENIQAQTIGVVTMCDKLFALKGGKPYFDAKRLVDKLGPHGTGIGSNVSLSPHGYVCLVNRDSEDAREGKDEHTLLLEQIQHEANLFANEELQPLAQQDRLGIQALISRLSRMYGDYLQTTWTTNTYLLVKKAIIQNKEKNTALGLPECDVASPELRGIVMTEIVTVKVPMFLHEMDSQLQSWICGQCTSIGDYSSQTTSVSCCSEINALWEQKDVLRHRYNDMIVQLRELYQQRFEEAFTQDDSPIKLCRFQHLIEQLTPIVSENCFNVVLDAASAELDDVLNKHFSIPSTTVWNEFSRHGTIQVHIDQSRINNDCLSLVCVKTYWEISCRLPAVLASAVEQLWPEVNDVESCVEERVRLRSERNNLLFARDQIKKANRKLHDKISEKETEEMWGISQATLQCGNQQPIDVYDTLLQLYVEGKRVFPANPEAYGLESNSRLSTLRIRRQNDDEVYSCISKTAFADIKMDSDSDSDLESDSDSCDSCGYKDLIYFKYEAIDVTTMQKHNIPPYYMPSSLRASDTLDDMLEEAIHVIKRATIVGEVIPTDMRDVTAIVRKLYEDGMRFFPFSYSDYGIPEIRNRTFSSFLRIKLYGKKTVVLEANSNYSSQTRVRYLHIPSGVFRSSSYYSARKCKAVNFIL